MDYALRILRVLKDGQQTTTGELCERAKTPQQFAYKILKKLSRSGMVSVTRGAEGGCRLKADLYQTTLFDLMKAMEAEVLINACMETGYTCTWRQACNRTCEIHTGLGKVQAEVNSVLRAHTLASLLGAESA